MHVDKDKNPLSLTPATPPPRVIELRNLSEPYWNSEIAPLGI